VSQPDEGQIEIHGRLSGLLDLGTGFHSDLTGRENVFINGVVSGLTRSEVADEFDSIIDFAELGDVVDSPLRTYSNGMQLRLAFAVAVHIMPEVLLIDEILAVGDAAFQQKCLNRIRQFKMAMCSIVVVSHDAGMIREICDSALLLSGGRVAAYGDPAEVTEKYLSGEGDGCELCGAGGAARLHSEL
jgi:lipopolysaccharide transport system ATP-binding protein